MSLHPRVPEFWIKAAKWEIEGKGNAQASRTLYQKGVRSNPESETLWLEFFRFELEFAARLAERRQVLGLISAGPETVISSASLAVLVHKHSLKSLPVSPRIQAEFFDIAEEFSQFSNLQSSMLKILKENEMVYKDSEIACFILTKKLTEVEGEDGLVLVLREFSELFPVVDKTKTLSEAADYLFGLLVKFKGSEELLIALHDKLDQMFQMGQDLQILDPSLYLKWIELNEIQSLEYIDILKEATVKFPDSSVLSYKMANYLFSTGSPITEVLIGLSSVKVMESEFWDNLLTFLGAKEDVSSELKALISNLGIDLLSQLSLFPLFSKLYQSIGSTHFSIFCRELLSMRAVGKIVYDNWIEIAKDKEPNRVTELYEKVLDLNPADTEVWISFIKHLMEQGDLSYMGIAYKKALGTVPNPTALSDALEQLGDI